MELVEFESNGVSLSNDFIGFPLIREELLDIVKYLQYLTQLDHDAKHDQRRMLIQSECGSLFLGRTGTGKTHALQGVITEARAIRYFPVDGSTMLENERVGPKDVKAFFQKCREKSSAPLQPHLDEEGHY